MRQQTDAAAVSGRILVVDDDPSIRAMLVEYLGSHRYDVRAAGSGQLMRAEIERDLPDLILLDIRLPGEDGLTLARYLRERFDVGIIMVTASGDVIDRVVGLEVGADDYVAKPFDLRELLARVKSVLRRMQTRPALGAEPLSEAIAGGRADPALERAPPPQPDRALLAGTGQRVRVGRCWLDVDARRLFELDGSEVAITAMEFELLRVFLANPNRVLSRDQLLQRTRNRDWEPFDRSIDIRIGRLRRKIEPGSASGPLCIRTVRNAGYLYVPLAGGLEGPA
jgi:two-component system phosphate regulon response regulator OmpR